MTKQKPINLFVYALICALTPELAFAQAGPFLVGTSGMSTSMLAILGPVAGMSIMAAGALAWFNRISWMWFFGAVIGTVLVFGNAQVVTWIRGLFGV